MTSRLDASYAVIRKTGVPTGWQEKKVADLVRVVGGGTPNRDDSAYWRDGGIPWITPTDLTANKGKYIREGAEHISDAGLANSNATLAPPGSIIFSTRGTVGNLAIAGVPLTTNQSCETLVPKDVEVSSEFLYYLLNYGMFAFHRLAGGTTFGAITRREIGRVWLALPDGNEQAAIARVLDSVDAAIDRAQNSVDAARNVQASVIQSLVAKCVSSSKSRTLGDLILEGPTNGLYRPESDYGAKGTPIVRIDSFDNGSITNLPGLRRVVVPSVIRERFALKQGDVLINRVNALTHVGKAAVVPELSEPTLFESNMMRLRCAETLVPDFLGVILRSDIARRHWLARSKPAVNQVSVNQRDTKSLCLPLPDLDRQREVSQAVHAADALILRGQERISTLQSLKESLMHDLLTGAVRVSPTILQEQQA